MNDLRIPYKHITARVAQFDQALNSSEALNHPPVPLYRILCMRRCLYSLSVFNKEDNRIFCRFSKICQHEFPSGGQKLAALIFNIPTRLGTLNS
jgi:hypothetical protein